MKINYKLFSKHAEKVAKGVGESRPILKGIEHREDGTLTVTDSHRLYRAYNVNAPRGVVLDAVSGEEIDAGTYPDTDRILPSSSSNFELTVSNIKTFKATLKAMKTVAKSQGIKHGHVYIGKDGVSLRQTGGGHEEIDEQVWMTYPLQHAAGTEECTVLASLDYVLEAVEMYDDMSKGHAEIVFRLHGKNKPFTIDVAHVDDITALVLPIKQ